MSANGHVIRFVRLRSIATGQWLAHPELRSKLVADADAKDTSLTDVVIEILCDRYGVPFDGPGRRTSPSEKAEELNLQVPAALDQAISVAASMRGHSTATEIRATLCSHYALGMPERTGRRRVAAA